MMASMSVDLPKGHFGSVCDELLVHVITYQFLQVHAQVSIDA